MSAPRNAARALLLMLLSSPAAAAAGERAWPLSEVVRHALAHGPEVQRARVEVDLAAGARNVAAGAFDTTLRLAPGLEHVESDLMPETRHAEEDRRETLRISALAFGAVRRGLAGDQPALPPCPRGFSHLLVLDGEPFPVCAPPSAAPRDTRREGVGDGFAQFVRDLFPTFPGRDDDMGTRLDFILRLARVLGPSVDRLVEDTDQRRRELTETLHVSARRGEVLLTRALERLGMFPVQEIRKTLRLEASLSRTLRGGTLLQLEASLGGRDDNYRGKPLDPVFGGKPLRNRFESSLALVLAQPLGRGRGSARAAERATAVDVLAARARVRHAAAVQAAQAAQAAIELLAAQGAVDLLEASAHEQQSRWPEMQSLLERGEATQGERALFRARRAEIEAAAAQGRLAVFAAQARLAEAMGLDDPGAVAVRGALPLDPIAGPDEDGPVRALGARGDLQAARHQVDASARRREVARADARPRLDLSLRAGLGSDYFSPYFRVLPDELRHVPYEPRESATDYFHPRGGWRSLGDRWLPSAAVELRVELPFGNRAAAGRVRQASAALREAEIHAAELGRIVRAGVVEESRRLARSAEELRAWREAAARQEEAVRASLEQHRAGETSALDVLLTERATTTARLELLRAQREHALAALGLRFEAGELVRFDHGEVPRSVRVDDLVRD